MLLGTVNAIRKGGFALLSDHFDVFGTCFGGKGGSCSLGLKFSCRLKVGRFLVYVVGIHAYEYACVTD